MVVNSGLNARFVQKTFERAQQAYRLRFLTEKYNLDLTDWTPLTVDAESMDIPLVHELIEAELAQKPADRGSDEHEDAPLPMNITKNSELGMTPGHRQTP